MDNVFVTLFDSNYLDKGLVLYDSMRKHMSDFKLYVIAFDDICYKILRSENLPNMIVVSLNDFETDDLKMVKKERSQAEYCWTCSSWSIYYVLTRMNETICTYIDADMMFFSDPQKVFDEMRKRKCSIIIVPHRFKNVKEEKKAHETVGSYCVEFNTFVNDENGLTALKWWANKCLEWCYYAVPGTTEWYGDQKYLNVFPDKFKGVMICEDYGVGLAPWNSKLVKFARLDGEKIKIEVDSSKEIFTLCIYHFESVYFLTNNIINVSSGMKSKELHRYVYDNYVNKIMKKRKYLQDRYNVILPRKKRVLTKNFFLKFYQKFISPIKRVKKLSDLYWVRENGEKQI